MSVLPVIERIAQNIQSTLEAITVENGFNQTLHIIRPSRCDFEEGWGDLTVLVSQVEADEVAPATFTRQWRQYFILTAFVIDDDKSQNTIDTRLNTVRADIEKKIMEDRQRGGLAIDTDIHEAMPFYDEKSRCTGIAIKISVHYRTKDNDPYTQA